MSPSETGKGVFPDRTHAGRELATQLSTYRNEPTGLVLALPRGGVVVGYEISLALGWPLDVFIVRKLSFPDEPEYAIGALTEMGSIHLNQQALRVMGERSGESPRMTAIIQAQREEIRRQQQLYRKGRPLPELRNRTVLVVDDGVATGSTFLAAVEALRSLEPHRLVAALPVGPDETLRVIGRHVDDLIVLCIPESFVAVGNHYLDFRQVTDEEVLDCLERAAAFHQRTQAASIEPPSLAKPAQTETP